MTTTGSGGGGGGGGASNSRSRVRNLSERDFNDLRVDWPGLDPKRADERGDEAMFDDEYDGVLILQLRDPHFSAAVGNIRRELDARP